MEPSQKNCLRKLTKYQNVFIAIVALLVIILIALSPIIFTKWSLYDLTKSEVSNIGNAIGGITAPIIGIVSGLLIFYTFLKQNQFNRQQIINNNRDTLLNLFKDIKHDFESLKIKAENEQRPRIGISAIAHYINLLNENFSTNYDRPLKIKLLCCILTFDDFLKILIEYDKKEKHEIIKQIVLAYYNSVLGKFLPELTEVLKKNTVTDNDLNEIQIKINSISESIDKLKPCK